MTYLFVDTNVLLHYRRLEEIDWLALSKAEDLVIVLCPVVVRELDRHKVSHPQSKFRRRAQEIIASLHSKHSEMSSAAVRDRVRLEFPAEDPAIDFSTHRLRPELEDDWLIASILDWKLKHPGDEVKIVSADLGLSIKAKARGIATLAPLDTDKLAEELDVDEKRIVQLQKELAEIKKSLPRLSLCFWQQPEEQNFVRFLIQPPADYDVVNAADELAGIRSRYPPLAAPDKIGRVPRSAVERTVENIMQQYSTGLLGPSLPITKDDARRYNESLEEFYQSYESYLHELHEHQNRELLKIEIEIGLDNDGSSPAEDVDIHLHFPDGFQLFNEDDGVPEAPDPPSPPKRPGTIDIPNLFGAHNYIHQPLAHAGPPPNVSSPSIKRTNSYDVRSHVNKAKHGYIIRVAKFIAIFDSHESARSFRIDYSISAANLPKAASGNLSVVVEKP